MPKCSIVLVILLCSLVFISIVAYFIKPAETEENATVAINDVCRQRRYINKDNQRAKKCESDPKCVHVIMAANRNYLIPLMASIYSIQLNTNRNVYIHLLIAPGDGTLVYESVKSLVKHMPVEIAEFDDRRVIPLIKVWDGLAFHLSTLNYARFYLPYIFPTLDRTVYIDPDTIVLGDLGDLYDKLDTHPHNLHYLAAVPANLVSYIRSSYAYVLKCRDPEIESTLNCADDFFNAGVFVTDLQKWRDDDITGRSEDWMRRNTERRLWKWGSQPPLNLVFDKKWSRLGAEWNFRETGRPSFDLGMLKFLKIIHFTGKEKPWKVQGFKYWSIWCPYYPRRKDLWFCRKEDEKHPVSPLDYRFMTRLMHPI